MSIYHIDIETYSAADLKSVGAYRYAEDESTEILLLAIAKDNDEPVLWVDPRWAIPGVLETDPDALLLLSELETAEIVYAHNAQFELALLAQHLERRTGFKAPKPMAYRCTAAMARKAGLRAKLEHLSEDLELESAKAKTGKALIPFFCQPTPKGVRRMLYTYPEKARQFADYCLQDVRAEQEVYTRLKAFELKGDSLETYLFDIRLNMRGVPVNVPALHNAQAIIEDVQADVGKKFFALVGLNYTQRDKVFHWLRANGYTGEDMTAGTVEAQLKTATGLAKEALDLYAQLAYAAAKKVRAMLDCVCKDGTVKGSFLYHGAGTGRWSGRLIQPQNFKKPTIPKDDVPIAFSLIERGCDREGLELMIDAPALETVASTIRNYIGLPGGILDADYNAIEARIANWTAGQENMLGLFRRGDADAKAGIFNPANDIYLNMASGIYNRPVTSFVKKSPERTLGKIVELGAQYNLGKAGLVQTGESWGFPIAEDLAARAIDAYRASHDKLVALWKKLDRAAKDAMRTPGVWFEANKHLKFIRTVVSGMDYLLMKLPSGRTISYPKPELKKVWNERWQSFSEELTYWGQIPGKQIMGRIKLYGGKLLENASQGIAADLMSHGARNAERKGFDLFALIHDQALAANTGLCSAFVAALTELPDWAKGLPLAAEGSVADYYTKD